MFKKKLIALALVASLAITTLVGCGELEDTDVVSVVDGEEITVGVANFYMRMQQATMETYYAVYFGDEMWTTDEGDGTTYQDTMKASYIETLQEYYLVRQHAEELGVALTDEESAEIQAVVDTFMEENSEEVREKVSGTVENITEYLELQAIQLKAYDVIAEGADTEVTDEEAAQKKMTYVYFNYTSYDEDGEEITMTDEEVAEAIELAEELVEEAKASDTGLYDLAEAYGYNVFETTFDEDTTSLDADLLEVVNALDEGEYTEVMETDSAIYVAQLTSLLDRDATDAEIESIISDRQLELYDETVATWMEEVEITLDSKILSKIDFTELTVTMYIEDTTTEE